MIILYNVTFKGERIRTSIGCPRMFSMVNLEVISNVYNTKRYYR